MSCDCDQESIEHFETVNWNLLSHHDSYFAMAVSHNSSHLLDTVQHDNRVQHTPNPQAFEADLKHFKELFSKLKFSYLEQETKEKFLRAILDDPPLVIEASYIEWLQNQNELSKKALKDGKTYVDGLSTQLEEKSLFICEEYEKLKSSVANAEKLLLEISEMEEAIHVMNEEEGEYSSQCLPLSEILDALSAQKAQLKALEIQLEGKEEERRNVGKELNTATHSSQKLEEDFRCEHKIANELIRSRTTEGDRVSFQRKVGRWYQRVMRVQEQLAQYTDVQLKELDQLLYVTLASEQQSFQLALEFSDNVFAAATCTTPCKIRYDDLLDVCRLRNDPALFVEEFRSYLNRLT